MAKRRKKGDTTPGRYDALVVGADAGGLIAACYLAKAGRAVLVVDQPPASRALPPEAWISTRALKMLDALDLDARKTCDKPIREVIFHTHDFTRRQCVTLAGPVAYRVAPPRLLDRLRKQAAKLGVSFWSRTTIEQIVMGEDHAEAHLASGDGPRGRLTLFADAAGTTALVPEVTRLRLPKFAAVMRQACWRLAKSTKTTTDALQLVPNADGCGALCCFWTTRDQVVAQATADDEERAAQVFSTLLSRVGDVAEELAPPSGAARSAASFPLPLGGAMEMDTHIGKRALYIGQAGGFVAQASGEILYPSMWSGRIAAEVVDAALDSKHPQDALRVFDSVWRTEMADYLRPPHTDLQFLLPIVFTNEQMAQRLALALLAGENI